MASAHRIDLAAAWEPGDDGGDWSRSFGRPGGLTGAERVWLVLTGTAATAPVLNGVPLDPRADGRWEVTQLLRPRNRLVLPGSGSAAAPRRRTPLPAAIGNAWLEIVAAS